MTLQVFLQGKILGTEEFILSPAPTDAPEEHTLLGRCRWVTLLSEAIPRALLAELGLARVLLGSSGGGQFLLVLPEEVRRTAEDFLGAVSEEMEQLSGRRLRLIWGITENLGDWSVVRRRIVEEIARKRGAPLARQRAALLEPFEEADPQPAAYFARELAVRLQDVGMVGWSPEARGRIAVESGKHVWPVSSTPSAEAIPMARHAAREEDAGGPAAPATLAGRAEGRKTWGVLRGDVDNFEIRLRRATTVEEHVQLSLMYKQFFAGELELVCSLPEYWRKAVILYTGGDDFALYASWDVLIPLAREVQRLFHRFTEENLKDLPGPEGKTISMAISLAPEVGASPLAVYEEAGRRLDAAKSIGKDCIWVMGRTLEWRQLAMASELQETMRQAASVLPSPAPLFVELGAFYRGEGAGGSARGSERQLERPWRVHRALSRAFRESRGREAQRLRSQLQNEMVSKAAGQRRLRPAGRVALEWTKLLTEV
jgi:CRISPR-associated protein Csm1